MRISYMLELHLKADEFTIVWLPFGPRNFDARVSGTAAIHRRRCFGRHWPNGDCWGIDIFGVKVVIAASFRHPYGIHGVADKTRNITLRGSIICEFTRCDRSPYEISWICTLLPLMNTSELHRPLTKGASGRSTELVITRHPIQRQHFGFQR
jgi:hypothetical protein